MLYTVDFFIDGELLTCEDVEADNQFHCLEILAEFILSEDPDRAWRMSAMIVDDDNGRYSAEGTSSNDVYYISGRDLLPEK